MKRLLVNALAAALLAPGAVRAAGHPDISAIPLGRAGLPAGKNDLLYNIPEGPMGSFARPIVLLSAQPYVTIKSDAAPLNPNLPPPEERKQVPATIRFTIGGKALPPWELEPRATAYVISLDTVRANPSAAAGALAITVELTTQAEGVDAAMIAMPDPLLVSESQDGPLSALIAGATDTDVKAYLTALALEVAGLKEEAREAYEKLAGAKNEKVARFARRGLRLLSYELRERRLSGNLNEHFRWGLFLEEGAFFEFARKAFEECRVIEPKDAQSQFRCGEAFERLGGKYFPVLDYLERAATGAAPEAANEWYVLVVILKNRDQASFKAEQIAELKDQIYLAQGNIWGATRGRMRVYVTFLELDNEIDWPFRKYGGIALGPAEGVVAGRGWFDSVFSIHPRSADEAGPTVATVGGDEGPRGAGLSSFSGAVLWHDFMRAWYEQFTWAVSVDETGRGAPDLICTLSSGHQPTPHRGAACRAALHYNFSDLTFLRTKMTDLPERGTSIDLWRIEGPYAVEGAAPASGMPGRHVLDPLPDGPPTQTLKLVSDRDFIDLKKLLPGAGWARARATSWVFSPVEQDVRMWLGQNDGLAAWVNGRCVHRGDYYSAHEYEDRNFVDTVCSFARLRRGWNEISVVVEGWPAPRDKGWGFSVRLCDWKNRPLPGIAYVYDPPKEGLAPRDELPPVGTHYSWAKVERDFTQSLPQLTDESLRAYTGLPDLAFSGAIEGMDGFVAFSTANPAPGGRYRSLKGPWKTGPDQDVQLNNVLDWARESCAAISIKREGQRHDLLLLKPEALLAYTRLLREPPGASEVFKGRPPADRLLGYVLVPCGKSQRILFAVDCLLGADGNWPVDEEDLLEPLPSVFIPNPRKPKPRPAAATPPVAQP